MLLENHYVSCVAVYGILLAGCAWAAWEQIPGLQKRCRLCAHLGTPHVSPQFQATNGAAPVFSCINVSGAKLTRALCFTWVSVQHHRLSVSRSCHSRSERSRPRSEHPWYLQSSRCAHTPGWAGIEHTDLQVKGPASY